jgi:ADP-heptose:LPS heptosyltransferase
VDTGLTHIAAQQGTPTVTISRRPAVYFRDWPHTRLVAGSSCDPGCRRAEQEYAYNDRIDLSGCQPAPRVCPAQSSCLASVVPESVMTALDDLW